MPQIFQVLRCYKCSVFQVHQTRKDNKWVCKICGEKQSIKRHYGIGTGKECRTHVQKLNKLRGDKDATLLNIVDSEDSELDDNVESTSASVCETNLLTQSKKESKWSAYIAEPEQHCDTNVPKYINNKGIVFEIPSKRKTISVLQKKKRFRKSLDNNKYSDIDTKNEINYIKSTNISQSNLENFNLVENCLESQIDTNIRSQKEILNVTLNKVSKESKWAQYVDTEVVDERDDNDIDKNCNKQPLFSLCDDSEIDTILDL